MHSARRASQSELPYPSNQRNPYLYNTFAFPQYQQQLQYPQVQQYQLNSPYQQLQERHFVPNMQTPFNAYQINPQLYSQQLRAGIIFGKSFSNIFIIQIVWLKEHYEKKTTT